MKKIIILLVFLIIPIVFYSFAFNFYGGKDSVNGVYLSADAALEDGIETNYGFIKQVEIGNRKKYYRNNKILGEYFETSIKDFSINEFAKKMGLVVLKRTYLENSENIYAYSAQSPYKLAGENFNIQINISNEKVIIATPIIFGSF